MEYDPDEKYEMDEDYDEYYGYDDDLERCYSHGEKVNVQCLDCQDYMCVSCFIENHANHSYSTRGNERLDLDEHILECLDELEDMEEMLGEALADLEQNKKKMKANIDQHSKAVRQQIERQQKSLKADIDRLTTAEKKKIERRMKKIKENKEKLTNMLQDNLYTTEPLTLSEEQAEELLDIDTVKYTPIFTPNNKGLDDLSLGATSVQEEIDEDDDEEIEEGPTVSTNLANAWDMNERISSISFHEGEGFSIAAGKSIGGYSTNGSVLNRSSTSRKGELPSHMVSNHQYALQYYAKGNKLVVHTLGGETASGRTASEGRAETKRVDTEDRRSYQGGSGRIQSNWEQSKNTERDWGYSEQQGIAMGGGWGEGGYRDEEGEVEEEGEEDEEDKEDEKPEKPLELELKDINPCNRSFSVIGKNVFYIVSNKKTKEKKAAVCMIDIQTTKQQIIKTEMKMVRSFHCFKNTTGSRQIILAAKDLYNAERLDHNIVLQSLNVRGREQWNVTRSQLRQTWDERCDIRAVTADKAWVYALDYRHGAVHMLTHTGTNVQRVMTQLQCPTHFCVNDRREMMIVEHKRKVSVYNIAVDDERDAKQVQRDREFKRLVEQTV